MDAIVEKLKKEDLLVFDDGRYIMWAPGVEIPLTGKFFSCLPFFGKSIEKL